MPGYPDSGSARDRFVLDRRRVAPQPDAWRYQDLIVEDERTDDGGAGANGHGPSDGA